MRTLARAGHEAHLSSPERSVWFASRYCSGHVESPPSDDAERFYQFLLALVARERYDLLIACGSREAEIIFDNAAELSGYVKLFAPDDRARRVVLRKNAASRHAEAIGVPTPRTYYPADLDEVRAIAGAIDYPAVIKGELGSAASHVRYAVTPAELVERYREVEQMERADGGRPSVQEYIPGHGFVVHCLFRDGRPLAICAHRKDREYPVGGGVTSAATTVHEPELDRAAFGFLASLRWTGLAKLDFKQDSRDGRFVFLEVDPRVSASIDITRAAGVDQVLMLCELAAGGEVKPQLDYRAGVRYRWVFPRDLLSLLARPWVAPRFLFELVRGGVHYDLDLGDLRPLARVARIAAWCVKHQLKTGAVWKQALEHRRLRRAGQDERSRRSLATASPPAPERVPGRGRERSDPDAGTVGRPRSLGGEADGPAGREYGRPGALAQHG